MSHKIIEFIAKKTPKPLLPFGARIYRILNQNDRLVSVIQEITTGRKNRALALKIKNDRELPKNFKIGFAVLAHERPEYLEACLDSLFRTKLHNYDITFLLQDDGSADPKVKELINKKRDSKYKIIRYFTKKGHNSWAGAFNKAMRKLMELDNFDVVGSCDSDCLFHPDWLEKTMKIALWAKKNHRDHTLVKFSSFNSDQWEFHKILGTYKSPYGKYVVKERMGDLNSFYFTKDLLTIGFYEESKDDETIMTEKFKRIGLRNFCTERSYIEHLGKISVLDQWRPVSVGEKNFTFAGKPALGSWDLPKYIYRRFPYLRHRVFVIQIFYGGLGDHLFYSHLPRIAKESGFEKVYISEYSEMRGSETKGLIWENNPYVDGFCKEKGYRAPDFTDLSDNMNLLDKLMLEQGLDDGKRFHEPELYYKPKLRKELVEKTVYDPNYISGVWGISSRDVENYLKKNRIKIDFQMGLRDNSVPLKRKVKIISSSSLEEFCDIVASCKRMYCFTTGTATLAAALGKKSTVFYNKGVKKMFRHSKLHKYVKLLNL